MRSVRATPPYRRRCRRRLLTPERVYTRAKKCQNRRQATAVRRVCLRHFTVNINKKKLKLNVF